MKYQILAALCVAVTLSYAACTQNEGMHMDHSGQATSSAEFKAALAAGNVDVGNTVCPVTGDKIGESKLITVYNGKIYHMCCSDCAPEFKKDPEKYAKLMAGDPAKYGVMKP